MFKYIDYDYILNIDIDEFLYVSKKICLKNYLQNLKKNNYSVIEIPSIDCGDPHNFTNNIKNLEVLKLYVSLRKYLIEVVPDLHEDKLNILFILYI